MSKAFFESLDKKNKTYNKNNELYKIPKADKKTINGDNIPHIKNNITKPNFIHQADILYLPTSQFGYKYALVVVDVSDSKCDAIALKTLDANSVLNGLKKIYEEHTILKLPYIIQFDSGTEFNNQSIKDYFENEKIRVKYTLTNRHRQNAMVEARNKVLGALIMKYQGFKEIETKKESKAWHTELHSFIEYMNLRITKPKPIDLTKDIAGIPDKDGNIVGYEVGNKVRRILDYPIKAHNNKKEYGKFRAGDIRWSKEIYKIMHVLIQPGSPVLYFINEEENSDKMNGKVAYTKGQLLKVD